MPVPLGYRVGTELKVRAVAIAAVAAPLVTEARHYLRETIDFDANRDGSPAVVIAKTPEQPVIRRKKLFCREVEYPFSIVLFDAGDGKAARGDEWRDAWRDAIGDELDGVKLTAVSEAIRVWNDDSVILDLSAWETAKLFAAPINLRVLCRLSVRTT